MAYKKKTKAVQSEGEATPATAKEKNADKPAKRITRTALRLLRT